MLKKLATFLLVYSVFSLSIMPILAQTQNQLKNSPILHYPGEVNENSKPDLKEIFAKENNRLKEEKTLTEADFKRLERESLNRQVKRNNLSTTAKVGIGVGISAVVVLAIVLATRDNDDAPLGPVQCGIKAPCP